MSLVDVCAQLQAQDVLEVGLPLGRGCQCCTAATRGSLSQENEGQGARRGFWAPASEAGSNGPAVPAGEGFQA